jgi:threonine dehydratase
MIPFEWFQQAAERISGQINRTPLTHDPDLNVFFKWENRQVTGSFKSRGALNKIFSLAEWEQARGLVTASAGNHGQGVALSGKIVAAPVIVFASDHAVPTKVNAMRMLGADIRFVNGGYGLAEKSALEYASKNQATYISPYNDGQVIAGQGTIALEVFEDLPEDQSWTWIIPVGGGGLISGIGSIVQHQNKSTRVVGVQAEASAFAFSIFHHGTQTNIPDLPTLADGLSGPVQEGSITIPIMKNLVDDVITVSEEEISMGIAFAWKKYHEIIEGSAAAALAAVLSGKIKPPAMVIITGGNIQPESHEQICMDFAGRI